MKKTIEYLGEEITIEITGKNAETFTCELACAMYTEYECNKAKGYLGSAKISRDIWENLSDYADELNKEVTND